MQEIRSSNPPVVTGICDRNKSRARHYCSLKLGSKLNYLNKIYYFFIDVAHHISCWSTCKIEIHLCTRTRLMTFSGCHSEKLSDFKVCIFQLILITKMQFFFGSMWLINCSWFFFSCKSFLLGTNKISCIHGSFLLSPTLPEAWNFHPRPEECVRYVFFFSFLLIS